MKKILKLKKALFLVPIVLSFLSQAQMVKPLRIGDKVPDIYFAKMLNNQTPNGRLSDFKGKAIIIDMWFHTCAPCIGAMPHLDSLQHEFKDDLQILPVTWESQTEIEAFWKKNPNVNDLRFVQVVEDSIVKKLFPAINFPHQIWIDKSGIVKAITDGRNATRENIERFINSKNITLAEKKDELDGTIRNGIKPLIMTRFEENKKNLIHYSYFSNYRNEFNGSSSREIDSVNNLVRWKLSNWDFIRLYHFAYLNTTVGTFHRETRVIRMDHNSMTTKPDDQKFLNYFCYDLIYKNTSNNNLSKYMISDLDHFLGFKSHEELRDVPCYIIQPNGKGTRYREPLNTGEKDHLYNYALKQDKIFSVSNQLVWSLERVVNECVDVPLLLFEFSNEKRISFEVIWNVGNIQQMNLELAKYDLKIEKSWRKRKVIILEDAK